MPTQLIHNLLEGLDKLAGGGHAGFRPVHAKGQIYAGTFTRPRDAPMLTRAADAARPSTPITVRCSLAAGIPGAADKNPNGSSPQAIAILFHLAEHAHTDIIAHSINGFPTRTGEEFLEFIRAAAASGPGAASPPPIAAFLATHPAAKAFVEAPHRIPASYATQPYFAITAFKFTNQDGASRFGRFRILPEAEVKLLTPEEAANRPADFLAAEMSERLAHGPVKFRAMVQLAEPGDDVADSTALWPESRPLLEFGTLTVTERVDELAPE